MKATGRRAWRQRAKRKRWGYYDWLLIKRHRWIVEPDAADPVNLVKPFTPLSLVGMTMGARKRRWAKDYDALPTSGRASKTVSMLRSYGIFPKDGNPLAQRLRPCPGCSLCKGVGCYACYPKFDQDCDACVNGMSCLCDGSGVLPAKRSAR